MEKNKIIKLLRYLITISIVGVAIVLGVILWHNYMDSPWTRDGRVRADVVMIAPDVSGLVSKVYVKDNQYVQKGDKLFQIDKERFIDRIRQLEAIVKLKKANYLMREKEYLKRSKSDNSIVSQESKDNAKYQKMIAKEELNSAIAQLDTAKLDLQRSTVYASENGWVSNLLLKKGDFIKIGESHLSIISEKSFWVYGYFEENKISQIKIGDQAIMNPLGTNFIVKGHVESISNGITDRDNHLGGQLLANINPSFSWVRLAQRIPVRITIDSVPKNLNLRAGMTCTVDIKVN